MTKLKVTNNWEVLEWSWNGNPLDPNLVQSLTVQFPDGTVRELPVVVTKRNASYSDMGVRRTASSDTMHMVYDLFGKQINLPLYGREGFAGLVTNLTYNDEAIAAAKSKLSPLELAALGLETQ